LVTDEDITIGSDLGYIARGVVYDYDSDSDLDSDSDEGDLDVDNQTGAKATAQGKKETTFDGTPRLGENKRAIFIRDMAFKTWKSLVFYFYTREVSFKR